MEKNKKYIKMLIPVIAIVTIAILLIFLQESLVLYLAL